MASKRTNEITAAFDKYYGADYREYPDNLTHNDPFQLLIATILSAQCTDARVNMVTPGLFKKYPDVYAFADADIKELEDSIHSCGFYHNKARNIIACSKEICERFDGVVPEDIDSLVTLPGVGRKTANVIRGNIFNTPSIVVDTHVGRISRRLGFTQETVPEKVENDLMNKLPQDHWILWNLQLIKFGREICKSQNPKCSKCFVCEYCTDEHGKAERKKRKNR